MENVAVGTESTIQVRGQAPSFEDMEAASAPDPGESAPKKEVPTRPEKEAVEKVETKGDNSSSKSPEKKDAEKEGTKEVSSATEKTEATKYVKAKHNDAEIELATETVIPTKVAGKLESPTLSELQANYSGKINWDRKYTELSKDRADHDQSVGQINELIGNMLEASKDDPYKFFDVISEATGRDSVEMKMEMIDQQIAMATKLARMSPEQLQGWKRQMALQFKEDSINTRENRLKKADEVKAQQTEVSQTMDRYSIEDSKYQEAEKVAREYITDRPVTPKEVVFVDRHLMTLRVLEKVNPALAERGDYPELVQRLRNEAIDNPGYTEADITEIVTGMFGNERTQRLATKIKESETRTSGHVKTFDNKNKVLHSFDQL